MVDFNKTRPKMPPLGAKRTRQTDRWTDEMKTNLLVFF